MKAYPVQALLAGLVMSPLAENLVLMNLMNVHLIPTIQIHTILLPFLADAAFCGRTGREGHLDSDKTPT